jgi:hypothetical protein
VTVISSLIHLGAACYYMFSGPATYLVSLLGGRGIQPRGGSVRRIHRRARRRVGAGDGAR